MKLVTRETRYKRCTCGDGWARSYLDSGDDYPCPWCHGSRYSWQEQYLFMSDIPCSYSGSYLEGGLHSELCCIGGNVFGISQEHYEYKTNFFGQETRKLVSGSKKNLGKCPQCFGTGKLHYEAEKRLFVHKGCSHCRGNGYIVHDEWVPSFFGREVLKQHKVLCNVCKGQDLAVNEERWEVCNPYKIYCSEYQVYEYQDFLASRKHRKK